MEAALELPRGRARARRRDGQRRGRARAQRRAPRPARDGRRRERRARSRSRARTRRGSASSRVRGGGPGRRRAGDWDASCPTRPTCATDERAAPEIARYEPAAALRGGPDGLDVDPPRSCGRGAAPPGLALEVGAGQAARGRRAAARRRPRAAETRRDLAGIERVVVASALTRRTPPPSSAACAVGGVAVFPADTVYGLACEPESPGGVERLYALKGRPARQARGGDVLRPRARARGAARARPADARGARAPAARARVTLLLPNPAGRFPLACGPDPATLGCASPRCRPLRRSAVALAGPPVQRQPRGRPRGAPPRRGARADPGGAPTSSSTRASCPGRPPRWSTCAATSSDGGAGGGAPGRGARGRVAAALS